MRHEKVSAADEYPSCPRLERSCPLRINGWRCRYFEDAVTCDEENGEDEDGGQVSS